MMVRIDDRTLGIDDFLGVLRKPVFARIGIETARGCGGRTDAHDFTPSLLLLLLQIISARRRQTPSRIITVGVPGSKSREIFSVRSVRTSIANCWPIRRMNSSSGVAKRCIGNTTEARSRRVISDMPSSDIV